MTDIFPRGFAAGCQDARDVLAGKPAVVASHETPAEEPAWSDRYDFLAAYSRGIQHVLNAQLDRRQAGETGGGAR
jgi:hypothetical protein